MGLSGSILLVIQTTLEQCSSNKILFSILNNLLFFCLLSTCAEEKKFIYHPTEPQNHQEKLCSRNIGYHTLITGIHGTISSVIHNTLEQYANTFFNCLLTLYFIWLISISLYVFSYKKDNLFWYLISIYTMKDETIIPVIDNNNVFRWKCSAVTLTDNKVYKCI